ncbi:hypothetical protein QMZ05_11310 [Bradyrhizobium sp. INPA03-11B]|uniref:hypothetical protein n=1 Tax=Bradyrhizobium sp. INPA03-11B TaxID=418598 RepID=UPI00338D8AE3
MLVRINDQLIAALEEADDLKRFSVAIDAPAKDLPSLKDALQDVGLLSDDGHMWVSEDWLRKASPRSSDEAWQQNLTAMIDAVREFGWIDEQTSAIRAHVVWKDTPKPEQQTRRLD